MEQVHSLFGNLPHGDVVLTLMRPTNVTAVHRILHSIASTKRKSREGNFVVEVFGQAEGGADIKSGKSPALEPRPENAPLVDPEILTLFENDGESPVFQEREVRRTASGTSAQHSCTAPSSSTRLSCLLFAACCYWLG